jgi:hypothetical protein
MVLPNPMLRLRGRCLKLSISPTHAHRAIGNMTDIWPQRAAKNGCWITLQLRLMDAHQLPSQYRWLLRAHEPPPNPEARMVPSRNSVK